MHESQKLTKPSKKASTTNDRLLFNLTPITLILVINLSVMFQHYSRKT